jgi:hypothetical protein
MRFLERSALWLGLLGGGVGMFFSALTAPKDTNVLLVAVETLVGLILVVIGLLGVSVEVGGWVRRRHARVRSPKKPASHPGGAQARQASTPPRVAKPSQAGLLPALRRAGAFLLRTIVVPILTGIGAGLLTIGIVASCLAPQPMPSPTPRPAPTETASPTASPTPTPTLLPTAPPYSRGPQPTYALLASPAPSAPLKGTIELDYPPYDPNDPCVPEYQDLKCRWVVIRWQEPNPEGVKIRIYAVTVCREWSSSPTLHCVIPNPPIQEQLTWVADIDATKGFHRFPMVKAAGTTAYLDKFPAHGSPEVYAYEVQAISDSGGSANVVLQ